MKISYNTEVDALSIVFRETTTTTKHISDNISIDYDEDGQVVGIEILEAVENFGSIDTLKQIVFEGAFTPSFKPISATA
jgi:uncharacterized protein YuzE